MKRCFDCAFCAEAYSRMSEYCELLECYISNVDENACKHFVNADAYEGNYSELLERKRRELKGEVK